MMNRLEQLRSFLGIEFNESPSPLMRWLRPVVVSVDPGHLVFQYQVRKEMTNPMGTLHGGITSAIIDDIIGATLFSLNEPNFFTSINLQVDFFSTAREGDTILAVASVVKKGKQFIHAQCEVWNANRTRLLARGSSNLFKTEMAG
jgi:uncharacterized protein (TIGR00369 family)